MATQHIISILVVAVGSLPIVWVSRRSLLRPESHGFSRFFAFEAILALVVVNAPSWFVRPLAPRQLASWLLLTASLVTVVWGLALLRREGRFGAEPARSTDFAWESTEILVDTGIYRHVRHPMYASLLFLAWGALLKSVSPASLALAGIATVALVATARAEEAENVARFGDAYREYMKRTRRFVPFVF